MPVKHNWLQRLLRTRETSIADTTVAEKLRSKKSRQIREVLKDHEVRVRAGDADAGSHRMQVVENTATSEKWRPGRFLGKLRPHRVRTFELAPMATPTSGTASGAEVDVRYIPMTKHDAWGSDLTSASAALMRTRSISLAEGELGVTPGLSGCSVVRKQSGTVGHLQPISGTKIGTDPTLPLPSSRSQTALVQQTTATSVFGPDDYHHTRTSGHVLTNTFIVGKGKGAGRDTMVSQSLHGTGGPSYERTIKTRKGKF